MIQDSVITVSQLTQAIKIQLEGSFPFLTLQGEVSNFKSHSSGHYYFCLKDSQAQISAVMYKGDAIHLRLPPKDGDQVIVKGSLTVYPPRGNYQLTVREITKAGLGALLIKLEELKIKLHKRGYFAKSRKRPLPPFPKIIGIVTSPTGAVIQDILNILKRRLAHFHIILNPVRVQGEGSALEIAQAIHDFNRFGLADVLIVCRGGGSIEDLWAFNEEVVADAIYQSQIPIIAAVGHETDHCIAEYVADQRAPTPSAAAEIISTETSQLNQRLTQFQSHLRQLVRHQISKHRHHLAAILKHPLFRSPYTLLGFSIQKLDDQKMALDQSIRRKLLQKQTALNALHKHCMALKPSTRIIFFRQQLLSWQRDLDASLHRQLQHKKNQIHLSSRQIDRQIRHRLPFFHERMERIKQNLASIDPKILLKRGYAILFTEKRESVITSIQALKPEQKVRVVFADGEATATIKGIYPRELSIPTS